MYYLPSNFSKPISRKFSHTHVISKLLTQDLTQATSTTFYTYIHLFEKQDKHYVYIETQTVLSNILNLNPKTINVNT